LGLEIRILRIDQPRTSKVDGGFAQLIPECRGRRYDATRVPITAGRLKPVAL
jgi:hypothetical protein